MPDATVWPDSNYKRCTRSRCQSPPYIFNFPLLIKSSRKYQWLLPDPIDATISAGKCGLNWGVRWTCAVSTAPYGPSVRSTIRVHQMHYLLSKSWLGAFSFPLTTCPSSLLCHKPPSSLGTALGLASLAPARHSGGGGGVEIPGDCWLDRGLAPLSSLWREVSCPSRRGSESVTGSEPKAQEGVFIL